MAILDNFEISSPQNQDILIYSNGSWINSTINGFFGILDGRYSINTHNHDGEYMVAGSAYTKAQTYPAASLYTKSEIDSMVTPGGSGSFDELVLESKPVMYHSDAVGREILYIRYNDQLANGGGINLYGSGDSVYPDHAMLLSATNKGVIVQPEGGIFLHNSTSTPPTPSAGGTLFIQSGDIKYKDSSGDVSILNIASTISDGYLDLIGTTGRPALFISGASVSEGDITTSPGEALQFGHWDGSIFTQRFAIASNGDTLVNYDLRISESDNALYTVNNRKILDTNGSFLHINGTSDFNSGVYFGNRPIRTDDAVHVGSGGSAFVADSTGTVKARNMELSNTNNEPALFITGANATEGDIAVDSADAFQLGHWDGFTFTPRLTVGTDGFVEVPFTRVTNEIRFVGGRGEDALIQRNAGAIRDELQIYAGGDAYSTGSRGAGIHLYGNDDDEHAGNFAVLTGQDNAGDARMIIAGGSNIPTSGGYRGSANDTRVTIGNDIWNFVDTQQDTGMLNLKNPSNRPALFISGASATEGDIAVPTGESLQIGHWTGSTFTQRFAVDSAGDTLVNGNLRITASTQAIYTDTGKIVMRTNSSFLYINGSNDFTSGVYFGNSPIRTDDEIHCGASGQYFKASSSGTIIQGGGGLTIDNPVNKPGILLTGASSTEGDLTVQSGEALQMGHWNGAAFTERLSIASGGNILCFTDLRIPNSLNALYTTDGRNILRTDDHWLRINQLGDFGNGIYTGQSIVRSDAGFKYQGTGVFETNANGTFIRGNKDLNISGGGGIIIDNPANQPAIHIFGAASNEGDLAVDDGDALQLGHWSGTTFTSRLVIDSAGDTILYNKILGGGQWAALDGESYNQIRTGSSFRVLDLYRTTNLAGHDCFRIYSDEYGTASRVFAVEANGDVQSYTNSYGGISDRRLKTEIVKASSQWEDIKKIEFVNYKLIEHIEEYGPEMAVKMLGVIAQQLEESGLEGLVDGVDGTDYKSVKYSIMQIKGLIALQEAQSRIEQLESGLEEATTKINSLESTLGSVLSRLEVLESN